MPNKKMYDTPLYEIIFFDYLKNQKIKVIEKIEADQNTYFFVPPHFQKIFFFIHGTGNDALFPHLQIFKKLLEHKTAIFTFDLLGHGRKSLGEFSYPDVFLATHQIYDYFKNNFLASDLPITYCGHSLGSWILLDLIQEKKLEHEKVILLSPPQFVSITIKFIWHELLGFFDADVLRHKNLYGNLYQMIPAFGFFKRHLFPVRVKNKNKNYIESIWNHDWTEIIKVIPQCQQIKIYGGENDALMKRNSFLFEEIKNATHFNLLFNELIQKLLLH